MKIELVKEDIEEIMTAIAKAARFSEGDEKQNLHDLASRFYFSYFNTVFDDLLDSSEKGE